MSLTQPDFGPNTLGALLATGERGWPEAFSAEVDGARIGVASSSVRFERQSCLHGAQGSTLSYVRVALDLVVEQGGERQIRHVEELFPCFVIEVLNGALDERAAERVRQAIASTLRELKGPNPVERFLACPISPMRLYEPILNALVAPPEGDSLAAWLGQHLQGVLCGEEDDTLVEVTVHGCCVKVRAREVAMQHNLRASGELKLVGEVEVCCAETGAKRGAWKSRAVLMKPSLQARSLPQPSSPQRYASLSDCWRRRLEENLTARLSQCVGRFRLSEVLPELAIDERDEVALSD